MKTTAANPTARPPTRKRPRAFTVTESVIAIVILSVAIPPMLWAIRQQQHDRVSPILASRARWLASEKLEDIIADRHSTTRGYSYLTSTHYPAESSITGFAGFTRSVAFNETTANLSTAGAGFMKTTVTVGWTDPGGVARSLSLATVITDYTP